MRMETAPSPDLHQVTFGNLDRNLDSPRRDSMPALESKQEVIHTLADRIQVAQYDISQLTMIDMQDRYHY